MEIESQAFFVEYFQLFISAVIVSRRNFYDQQ